MSKINKTVPAYNLTSPASLPVAIYFSIHFENKTEYLNFVTQYSRINSLCVRELLIESKMIPKYFDIIAVDALLDLKTLTSPITMEPDGTGYSIVRPDKDNQDSIQIYYATFLSALIKGNHTENLRLAAYKKNSTVPILSDIFNNPDILNNSFVLNFSDEHVELCPFDYQFPQKCVFAIPFVILGNSTPIEKFELKLNSGIELGEDFEEILQDMLENSTVEALNFDLLENAEIYDSDLVDAKFINNIENIINEQKSTIIYYENFPVFLNISEYLQIDIRLPFLTFDMYAQNIFSHSTDEDVVNDYYEYTANRITVAGILDNMGLCYNYILGQRVDFIHEPEMSSHILSKVTQRDVLKENVYFEESEYEAVKTEGEKASLVGLQVVEIINYPINIISTQSKSNIIKQINAYSLNLDEMDKDMKIVMDYFANMDKDVRHVVIEDTTEISYCEKYFKITATILN